jgi:hypothetical protein
LLKERRKQQALGSHAAPSVFFFRNKMALLQAWSNGNLSVPQSESDSGEMLA